MTSHRIIRSLLTCAFLAAFGSSAAVLSASHPDLSGTWKLNKDLSDNPREKMREARKSRGGLGPGAGGMSPGGPGMGGVMGPGGGFSGRGRYPEGERKSRALDASATIRISGTDPELIVDYGNDRQRHLFTDGRTVSVEGRRSGSSKVRTVWNGDRLEVRTTRDDDREMLETFDLNPQTGRLEVTMTGDASAALEDESRSFRRVYDRSAAAASAGQPGHQ
ncbi:MAG: hypothetical protein ABI718_17370 [Acidobacteriota bacterium]